MLRFRTPAIIKLISKRSLKVNKSRNLVSIAAIILTTGMFTALFSLALSQIESSNQMYMREVGTTAHATLKNIMSEEADKISGDNLVKEAGFSTVVSIAENKEISSMSVELRYADNKYMEMGFASITKGSLPQAENEVAMDTRVLEAMGLKSEIGETITLKWRDDFSSSIYSEKEFTVVGIWTGADISQSSTAWVSEAFINEYYSDKNVDELFANDASLYTNQVRVMLTNDNNIEDTVKQIIENQNLTNATYGLNWAYESSVKNTTFAGTLSTFGLMILVFISGYLIIYNIFQISVSADVRFYGMLKTLGVTQKHIKSIIYSQALKLSCIGIPIGLLLGYGIGAILLPYIVSNVAKNSQKLSVNPVIFIGSAIFALITVLISCIIPARKAKKISPIEALKYVGEDVKRNQKKSTSGAKITNMAFSNLGRNKKRSFIIVCSISLGMVLLSFIYAMNASYDIDKYVDYKMISNFSVTDSAKAVDPEGNEITTDVLEYLENIDGVTETGTYYYESTSMDLTEEAYNDIVEFYEGGTGEIYESSTWNTKWKETYEEMKDTKTCEVLINGIDGILETSLLEDNLITGNEKIGDFTNGNYAISFGTGTDYQQEGYRLGDTLIIGGEEFEIIAVCDIPMELDVGSSQFSLHYYIPTEKFLELFPDSNAKQYLFNVEDSYTEATETLLKEYSAVNTQLSYTSKETVAQAYKETTKSQTIIGQAMGIIIACVGILNFLNTMSTSIITRKKEFAVMQSIGMTMSQLKKMLILEGLFYTGLALGISYILSFLAVSIGVKAYAAGQFTMTYHFTLTALVICTPILILLSILIPFICYKNIEKKSLVERLRETA